MDRIFIEGLRIETIIGVFDWERQVKQTVSIDLEYAADCVRAARSDRLEDTLSYKRVAKRLMEFIGEGRFGLVETMAEQVASLMRDELGVGWVRLRINKEGALRGARGVGVIIERGDRG